MAQESRYYKDKAELLFKFTPLSSHGSKCFWIVVDLERSEERCFVLFVGFYMKWHPLELLFQLARCTVQVPLASAPRLQPVSAALKLSLPWCPGLTCTWSSGDLSRAETALYCGRHSPAGRAPFGKDVVGKPSNHGFQKHRGRSPGHRRMPN